MVAPIVPTLRVVLETPRLVRLLLVGVGGTGSALALALGGLLHHARQQGVAVELTLVDDDVVTAANVGRQAFAPAEARQAVAKATTLALRLNAAYGLAVTAWPQRYTAALGRAWYTPDRSVAHLLIGCVDNSAARRELAATVARYDGRVWALDCGNEAVSGQVLIGNLVRAAAVQPDAIGLCRGLPSPYVQEPALLLEPPDPTGPAVTCDTLAQRSGQSLLVNRLAAVIAAQYVADFVLRREVRQLGTTFCLAPTAMVPRQITVAALAQIADKAAMYAAEE